MKIAVTGASGFIGRGLVERLRAAGHDVTPIYVRQIGAVPPVDAVVHLAGEPVAQRWTAEAKRRILASRVEGTGKLMDALSRTEPRPAVFISASAIGIYGSRGNELLIESSAPGSDFLARVCIEWEHAADQAESLEMRVVKLRIGMVLERDGGALARMLPIFRMGLGGPIGSGAQWMSWIHRDDLLSLIEFALATPQLSGPVNATAPNPVRNTDFTYALAGVLHRPVMLRVPEFALRLAYGEMASVLLASQRVLPEAAIEAGFRFRYPDLKAAIAAVVRE